MRLHPILFAFLVLLAGCAPDANDPAPAPAADAPQAAVAAGEPVVEGAWIRSVPPTSRMTAGYLRIHNPGPEPLVIVGAESPLFGAVEVHGTTTVDGVSRMRQQESVTVAPGETASFEPGGLHLMLMQATDAIPSDGTIELSLVLADGERIQFRAPVGQPAD
jgi:copper(I)-binding protein